MNRSKKKQEDYALRIYQKATPFWGYIVSNQRIYKQGFKYALQALKELSHANSIIVDDVIYPKYRLENSNRKFTKHNEVELKTKIEYTNFKTDEGDFLIAIWNWPNYNEYKCTN